MSTQDRSQRNEVEAILGSEPDAAEAEALAAFFVIASGPTTSGELPGEAAAVAAFRAAYPAPAPTARRAKILASLTALLTVKTAAAALAVTSVGGLALAAGTGALPTPLTKDKHTSVEQPAERTVPTAAEFRDAAKNAAAVDRADAKAGRDHSSSYAGLCNAFTAGKWDNARAAGNPAFTRLVATAPNGDVSDFCAALETEDPSPGKSKGKGDPAKPSNSKGGKGIENKGTGSGKSADAPGQSDNSAKSTGKAHGKPENAAGKSAPKDDAKGNGKNKTEG